MSADRDAAELAAQLALSPQAIEEAIRRRLLAFVRHRNCRSWRLGDSRNGSFRRIDGKPFRINGESVKAEAETRGSAWHRLIGIDDVVANDRRDILLIPEGSKDALAALHFADAEGTLERIGVVAALGAGVSPLANEIEYFRGRRVRIFADVDQTGVRTASRIGKRFAPVTTEVQIFSLTGLQRDDRLPVTDLFDLTRVDYYDFEANRDLWAITSLDSKGNRTKIISDKHEFFPFPLFPPHGFPESHGFHVYPVSNHQDLERSLAQLAKRNACVTRDTARKRRFKLQRDLRALEKQVNRELTVGERLKAADAWYEVSKPHLDPNKTRDWYMAKSLGEFEKVLVPTGDGEALKKALAKVFSLPSCDLPEIPGMPDAPVSWRRVLALHRELARHSANGTYFLSCRDTAKVDRSLNKDSANVINAALDSIGAIKLIQIGESKPGGDASIFTYVLSL